MSLEETNQSEMSEASEDILTEKENILSDRGTENSLSDEEYNGETDGREETSEGEPLYMASQSDEISKDESPEKQSSMNLSDEEKVVLKNGDLLKEPSVIKGPIVSARDVSPQPIQDHGNQRANYFDEASDYDDEGKSNSHPHNIQVLPNLEGHADPEQIYYKTAKARGLVKQQENLVEKLRSMRSSLKDDQDSILNTSGEGMKINCASYHGDNLMNESPTKVRNIVQYTPYSRTSDALLGTDTKNYSYGLGSSSRFSGLPNYIGNSYSPSLHSPKMSPYSYKHLDFSRNNQPHALHGEVSRISNPLYLPSNSRSLLMGYSSQNHTPDRSFGSDFNSGTQHSTAYDQYWKKYGNSPSHYNSEALSKPEIDRKMITSHSLEPISLRSSVGNDLQIRTFTDEPNFDYEYPEVSVF